MGSAAPGRSSSPARLPRRALASRLPCRLRALRRCRSEEHTSELQSHVNIVCRLLLEKKKIYVKLPLVEKPGEFILIWTKTPWNLPANLGVMVHPDKKYVLVDVEDDKLI